MPKLLPAIETLLADKAYGAKKRVISLLEEAGIEVVIPPKANAKNAWGYDEEKYKWRHLVENFFAKLKQYRSIATRYDKRASMFLGGIHLACAVIWLN